MPPKKTAPAGELTAPELRKLIRAHNILSKITIPKGTDRQGLIKLIEGKNYLIDHKNKAIKPQVKRGKQITLKKAEELTKPKPVSEAVKKQRAEKKKEQEEAKKKDIKIAKKEAVQEFKKKQKEAKKKIEKSKKLNDLKLFSTSNNKKDMTETAFIKNQKKLQLQKQKETRRALLKSKPPVDKTTRRGKPVKKKELTKEEKIKQLEQSIAQKKKDVEIMKKKNEEKNNKLSTEEKKKKIKQLEEQVKKKEEALKKKNEKKENLNNEGMPNNEGIPNPHYDPDYQGVFNQNPDDEYEKVNYKNINEEITDLLKGARQVGEQYSKGKVSDALLKVKPEDLIKVKGALKTKLKKDLDFFDRMVGKSIDGVSGEVEYTDNMKKLRKELLSLSKWDKYYPEEKKEVKKNKVLDSNSFKASNLNSKDLIKLIDSLGLDYRFNRGRLMIGTYRDFLQGVVSGGDFDTSRLKPVISIEEREKLPEHIRLLYSYSYENKNKDTEYKLLNKTSKKELVMKIKKFFDK